MAIPRIATAPLFGVASLSLIVGGGVYIVRNIGSQRPHDTAYTSSEAPETISSIRLGHPTNLSLPSLNKDLPIKEGRYDPATQQWTLDDVHVFYMQGSATPTFYGHNKAQLFDKLDELKPGDELVIRNDEGRALMFTYARTKTVAPDDTWLLNEKHNNIIMVLSCTGFFFESRQVFYFEYVGISS